MPGLAVTTMHGADLDLAVHCAVQGSFYSIGQHGTASSRLLVIEAIHDAFVNSLCAAMKELGIGGTRAPETQIDPAASETQLAINNRHIAQAGTDGATLAAGGFEVTSKTPGHYLSPALFTEVSPQVTVARDEIFVRIAAVLRVPNYDEALSTANDCEFGLSAGIVSTESARIEHFSQHSEAGMIQVNLLTTGMVSRQPSQAEKDHPMVRRKKPTIAVIFYCCQGCALE